MRNRAIHQFRAVLWGTFALALLCAAPAYAEIYRYVDEAGKVHYVESINKVPEQYRDQARPISGDKMPSYKGRKPTSRPGPAPVPSGRSTRSLLGDNQGRTQAYWCGERARIEAELKQVNGRLETLESRGPVNVDQAAGLKALYQIQQEIKKLKEQQATLEAELEELPNTVRKAGGNPGWVKGVSCPTDGPRTISEVGADADENEKQTREYWESLKKNLEEKRARIERSIERAESEVISNAGQEYDPVVAAQNDMLYEDLDQLRGDLAEVERELAELPAKAEAAGVPRSWVE